VLRQGFHCEDIEILDFMKTLDQILHQFNTDYVRRLFRDINTNLLRKFNKCFKKDEAGKNREWRDIEEGPIRDLWAKCRKQMLEVISDFKFIKLPKTAFSTALETARKLFAVIIL
jgi:hypothetical protein